jgi:exopolysaccharide biosynthesis polyprenyl glycosylphosphotransferase
MAISQETINGIHVLEPARGYILAKRALDIVVALAVLILFLPFTLIVAMIIKLTSRGPVIFRQTRVGLGGRQFTCYKFRSMVADAEEKREQIEHLNEADGPVFKIKNDPRITHFGAFLRKTSIDEVPQLWNVLKGDMSLVGPRPPLPCEVAEYTEKECRRLSVLPGLTCLWQISGRSNISFEHWVELDIQYIEAMSFRNDLVILLKTIPAVITARGAR